jgi:dynein intermediate chain 2
VSCSILAFQQQPAGMPLTSYVWDASNPNEPEATLLAPSQLVSARFNTKDTNLVGAGQYNGQFCYFDTRKGAAPVDSTPVDIGHRCGGLAEGSPRGRAACRGAYCAALG